MKTRLRRVLLAFVFLLLLNGCLPAPNGHTTAQEPGETEAQTQTVPPTAAETETRPERETEPPAPAKTEPVPDAAQLRLDSMTTEEKVAQLFVVTPEALTGAKRYVTAVEEDLRAAYDALPVGGVLCMGGNLKNPEQTAALCADLQAMSRARLGIQLFLCVDEEGGEVARISGNPAFGLDPVPAMAEVGAAGDPAWAGRLGAQIGSSLRELGFNVDFAPDADVLTNPENRIVRRRSFGSDPELVIGMAQAFSDGLLEQGVLPCWKHFPGHGGTAEDTHKGFAAMPCTMEELRGSAELKPFLYAAASGIPMIMTGHISVPEAGDDLPASLSARLLALLRGPECDYPGLLITDSLSMGAVTQRFTPGEAAVLALRAGNDLLLVSDHLQEAYDAVLEAVRKEELPEARIDESVLRILRIKEQLKEQPDEG